MLCYYYQPFSPISQDPVTTSNYEITTIKAEFAFDEEVTDTKNNVIEHSIDGDLITGWAGNLGNTT